MRKKILIIVDAQNDFINGALGSEEALNTVAHIVKKIKSWDGDIVVTLDTHGKNYLNTQEGKKLPIPHCIVNTSGHQIFPDIAEALQQKSRDKVTYWMKETFGSISLAQKIAEEGYDEIELIGYVTNICVVSNALILRAAVPEALISIDSACCCGSSSELHDAAVAVMNSCQIDIV